VLPINHVTAIVIIDTNPSRIPFVAMKKTKIGNEPQSTIM